MHEFMYKIYVLTIFILFFLLLGFASLKILHLADWWDIPMTWITTGAGTFVTLHLTKEDNNE